MQVRSAEKVAVRLLNPVAPLVGNCTLVKVCEVLLPKLPTATLAVPLPVRSRVPEKGALAKVMVTSAV